MRLPPITRDRPCDARQRLSHDATDRPVIESVTSSLEFSHPRGGASEAMRSAHQPVRRDSLAHHAACATSVDGMSRPSARSEPKRCGRPTKPVCRMAASSYTQLNDQSSGCARRARRRGRRAQDRRRPRCTSWPSTASAAPASSAIAQHAGLKSPALIYWYFKEQRGALRGHARRDGPVPGRRRQRRAPAG